MDAPPKWDDRWGYRRIVDDIRAHIAAGRLRRRSRKPCPVCGLPLADVALEPGNQLKSRSQFVAWYAPVSESTVSKALLILLEAGDTVSDRGVGVYVTPIPDADPGHQGAPTT